MKPMVGQKGKIQYDVMREEKSQHVREHEKITDDNRWLEYFLTDNSVQVHSSGGKTK